MSYITSCCTSFFVEILDMAAASILTIRARPEIQQAIEAERKRLSEANPGVKITITDAVGSLIHRAASVDPNTPQAEAA